MARVNSGHNHLADKARNNLTLTIIFFIPTIIYFYAFIAHGYHFDGPLHLLGVVPAAIGIYYWRQYSALKSGITGEEEAIDTLANLPSTHEVYSTVMIPTKENPAEIDNIVIGENGIFVVEVKNHSGTIEGTEEGGSWTQHKVGRKGGKYSKQMGNPVKQVRWQAQKLSEYLKENGINTWVEGIVFFSNPTAIVSVKTSKTPVFSSSHQLNSFIINKFRDENYQNQI